MLDEGHEHNGGGDGRTCVSRLPPQMKDELAAFMIGELDHMFATLAGKYDLCPVCTLNSLDGASTSLMVTVAHLDHKDILAAFLDAFSATFDAKGIRIAVIGIEGEDSSTHG